MQFTEQYDVAVVGAGHAGCEAAMAAARMGLKTALFTLNVDLIAQMSCNPAIGGIAKGHLVREVDALGGIMGEVTDAVGIQFRLLNTSRGPAVWSPRAQCDKQQYRQKMREVLESQPNLYIKQAEVAELIEEPLPQRHGGTEEDHLNNRANGLFAPPEKISELTTTEQDSLSSVSPCLRGERFSLLQVVQVRVQLRHAESLRRRLLPRQVILAQDRVRLVAVRLPERPCHHLQRSPRHHDDSARVVRHGRHRMSSP